MAPRKKVQRSGRARLPAAVPDDLPVQVWVELAYAYHRIARRLEKAVVGHGLTLAQFEVLARLHFDGPAMQTELAKTLLVSKGNICGLIDRMASADLVRRRLDPRDRRVNIIELTSAGRAALSAALPEHLEHIRRAMAVLSSEEQVRLVQGLKGLATDKN